MAGGYNRCVQLLVSMGLTIPFGGGQPTDPFGGCEYNRRAHLVQEATVSVADEHVPERERERAVRRAFPDIRSCDAVRRTFPDIR